MRVWRLTSAIHAIDPLSGRGAALVGGRWNSPGRRVAYASASRSLAVLELLVHVSRETVPNHLVFVPFDVPDRLVRELAAPPKGWNELPWSDVARASGDAWVESRSSLALSVPSLVVPQERNLLVNPLHPQFSRIALHPPEAFALDERLFPRP
jgi:RES domain-containing protein